MFLLQFDWPGGILKPSGSFSHWSGLIMVTLQTMKTLFRERITKSSLNVQRCYCKKKKKKYWFCDSKVSMAGGVAKMAVE